MQARFWGVRGSIPTPQLENLRYGGNTPCVEVRAGGEILIFDCGTGLRLLGQSLLREFAGRPIRAHIFVSHFHWDHIQGIPFFAPLYESPASSFVFHALDGIGHPLEGQMADPYFPVKMHQLAAQIEVRPLTEGITRFADCTVEAVSLNHPQGCFGFRVESGGASLVYATDNEPGNPDLDTAMRRLAQGVDLLVYDAQYLPEEYRANRHGRGHSHWQEAVAIARQCGVKHLVLFHHDPDRNDDAIDQILELARREFPRVSAAAEGLVLAL